MGCGKLRTVTVVYFQKNYSAAKELIPFPSQ